MDQIFHILTLVIMNRFGPICHEQHCICRWAKGFDPVYKMAHPLKEPHEAQTRTATRSCRTRKRTFHFYYSQHFSWAFVPESAGIDPPLLLVPLCIGK